jgi:hypothetical protein
MMKDVDGKEIKIGQRVVFVYRRYAHGAMKLGTGVVSSLAPKSVRVLPDDESLASYGSALKTVLPDKIAVIE